MSGGADKAIRVMTIHCENDDNSDDDDDVENIRFTIDEDQKPFTITHPHVTQITSVHWIDYHHLVSVSIDQRAAWRIVA